MPKILPVSDLRNYTEVLQNCDADNQVFLTKNGRGRYVIMDIDFYDKQQATLTLMSELTQGEASVQNENDWISIEDSRKKLGG